MMKRLFVISVGTALCAGILCLEGCFGAGLLAAQFIPAATVGGSVAISNASTKHYTDQNGRDADESTYDLPTRTTTKEFTQDVKRIASALNYQVINVAPGVNAGDEMIFLSKTQGGSNGVLGFGAKPPVNTSLTVRLSGGNQMSVSASVSGDKAKMDTKGDIDAFWKAFQGGQAPVVAAK